MTARSTLVAWALSAGAVFAVRADPLIFVPDDALANDTLTSIIANDVLEDAVRSSKGTRKPSRPTAAGATTIVAAGAPRAAASLAATFPAGQRAEAQRAFATLLETYRRDMEPRLGVPKNDLAGAVAAFIAGSWMAYRNVDFPDQHFKPLTEQMRAVLLARPEFARASAVQRQDLYERMAILGMFMATTQLALQRQPDAAVRAQLQAAAKRNLEQFLKVNPERVTVTAQGLVVR